mmetsp:Transcript_31116/g.68108  ORF Transcript_31116/g.68108 Transcript_31116/m.68108 type:complete len:102 (+) Transcript_31116:48-353(+)
MVLRHVVLLKFAPGVDGKALAATIDAGLSKMPALIPQIKAYKCGGDLGISEGNHDYAIVGEFENADDYKVYAEHPDHVAFIVSTIKPNLAPGGRVAVQYDI